MERIQKILAHGGIASRRAAEALIQAGRVRVNGRVVTELGAKADPRKDRIEVDGKRVVAEDHVYIVLHKPRGVVATMSDPEGRPTVKELISGLPGRVYPVGRLDFATSGVLIATNDGELAEGLLHPRKTVPKTYILKVKGVMKPDDVERWSKGVQLEDGVTLPADAKLIRHEVDKTWLELTIREGRNQQIRRMGEATRFPVMRLARVAFAGITAEGLAPGRWRHLTRDELVTLKKTFGVPRSIPQGTAITPRPAGRTTPRTMPSARKGAAGRAARAFGSESTERTERGADRTERGAGRTERGAGRTERGAERPQRGAERPQRGAERPQRGAERPQRGAERPQRGAERTTGPRYGGGSPVGRSSKVTEDWGGGAGRGSSAGRGEAPRPEVGRSGRPRTTGTAGGTGANENASRVKGRRGR